MVKPNWDTEELIENWTLLPTELELVRNKVGGNQIGFALFLKHFQLFTFFQTRKIVNSPNYYLLHSFAT